MSFESAAPGDAPQLRSLRDVRILLIGDRLVGKTSLIRTLMNDKFVTEVPPRSPDVAVPPEMTLKEVTTYIIDSSFRVQDEAEIACEVGKASVICVVYAADLKTTYERVSSYWLPFIRKHSFSQEVPSKTPVILVRNKSDLCEPSEAEGEENPESENALLNECWSVMQKFKEIVTCVDCSAKAVKHIPDVFHYALNSVLFPMAPLYDLEAHSLKPKVNVALDRVFAICDRDKDGLLNDDEVNGFQTCCFQGSEPLAAEELKNVKELIRVSVADGLVEDKVTKAGFMFLNQLFIERGKPETTWAVLRHFGYSDDLELKDHYQRPTSLANVPADCSMELSEEGLDFIGNLFETYVFSEDSADGGLSPSRLADVFAIAEEFPAMFTIGEGRETCSKTHFINAWRVLTLLDHAKATELLSLLGFCVPFRQAEPISVARAIAPTRRRVIDWETQATLRKSFLCYVVGPAGCRDDLHASNVGNQHGVAATGLSARAKTTRVSACSTVLGGKDPANLGNHALVVFAELDGNDAPALLSSDLCAEECDVVVLLYDESDPESFAQLAAMQASIISPGPGVLVVGTNARASVDQNFPAGVESFCKDKGIAPPIHALTNDLEQVVESAAELASSPPSLSAFSESNLPVYLGVAAAVAVIGFVAYRRYAPK